jgi:hypothetical protein
MASRPEKQGLTPSIPVSDFAFLRTLKGTEFFHAHVSLESFALSVLEFI